jgi:glutathione S-transferase
MIKLFHRKASIASQKIRVYLAEKALSWHSELIDLETINLPVFRLKNPVGALPAMCNERGELIFGSTQIIEYLEANFRNIPLWSEKYQQRKQIHRFCQAQDKLYENCLMPLTNSDLLQRDDIHEALFDRLAFAEKQTPESLEAALVTVKKQLETVEIEASRDMAITTLDALNALLDHSDGYLFGDHYTFADSVATASVYRLDELGFEGEIALRPLLADWWGSMQTRESFESGILKYLPEKNISKSTRNDKLFETNV